MNIAPQTYLLDHSIGSKKVVYGLTATYNITFPFLFSVLLQARYVWNIIRSNHFLDFMVNLLLLPDIHLHKHFIYHKILY